MREIGSQKNEEGLIFVSFSEIHRFPEENVVAITFVLFRDIVMSKYGVEITVPRGIPGLTYPAGGVVEAFLKTFVRRPYRKVIPEMPFSENACAISRRLENLGNGRFILADDAAAVIYLDRTGPFGIAPSEECRPRRCAEGLDVEVGELGALFGQSIQVRRAESGISVKAHVTISLVIGQD